MSIIEQVKELRELADALHREKWYSAHDTVTDVADTIEALSAKPQATNEEFQKGNYSIGDLSKLIDKFDNEKIKGITDFEQVQIFNALKYLDMYQKVGTIKKFMELKQNTEQSAEDCGGGWIYCGDGKNLPEIECDVLLSTRGLDVYKGYRSDTEGYFYTEEEGYILYENVLAWMPQPEPYQGARG